MTTTADLHAGPIGVEASAPADPGQKLRLAEKIGYASGDFASCLYFGIFMRYLLLYYTDVMVIGAAAVGTMMLITRTWDWINDIIMGAVADRTETCMGKFRPWLLWMIAPYVLVGILTFTAFDLSPGWRLAYAYVTYTALTMVYTMINVPYSALMGVMTSNSEERTVLASFRFIGGFTGATLVAVSLPYLVELFGKGNDKAGYSLTVSTYAVMAAAAFFFTFKATKERIKPPPQHETSIRADLKALSKNGPWVAMICVSVLTIVWIAVRTSSAMHFFKYAGPQIATIPNPFGSDIVVDGGVKLGGWHGGVGAGVQIVGVLMTKHYVRWFGSKKRAFAMLNFLSAAWIALFYFVDPSDFWMIVAHEVVASMLYAALMPMFWAMIADTADYGAWKLKQRSTGLLFSAGTFSQKIGWTLGPAIPMWLLGYFGFQANEQQAPETLHGLRLIMSVIPAFFAVLAGLAVMLYKIDGITEKEMAEALAEEAQAQKLAAAV